MEIAIATLTFSLRAHNLKVIGSNPIPATRKMPTISMSWWAFSCANLPQSSLHGPIQQMLINPRLSKPVASFAGSSMSHVRHMDSDALFSKRSHVTASSHASENARSVGMVQAAREINEAVKWARIECKSYKIEGGFTVER